MKKATLTTILYTLNHCYNLLTKICKSTQKNNSTEQFLKQPIKINKNYGLKYNF